MFHLPFRAGICLAGLAFVCCFSGCYSMNGYMMNASGQAMYERGNYSMAASEFEKAVASAPKNPDYTANLARTKYKMGDVAGAEKIYRHNLTLSPSHQPSYHGLAEVMLSQGRSEEATAMMSTWTATQPYVAESHLEMAWLQKQLGDPNAAAQSLQQALQVSPGHPRALAHLGEHYQQTGQHNQAVALYQQSLQAQWNQPEVHSRMSSAIAAAGPQHPVNATAMAHGARARGFGPRLAAAPVPPMMAQTIPHHVSPGHQSPVMASHTAAFPPMGFSTPVSGTFPAPTSESPANATTVQQLAPTPDPAFSQPAPLSVPAATVSQQTQLVPQDGDSVPTVDAF